MSAPMISLLFCMVKAGFMSTNPFSAQQSRGPHSCLIRLRYQNCTRLVQGFSLGGLHRTVIFFSICTIAWQ